MEKKINPNKNEVENALLHTSADTFRVEIKPTREQLKYLEEKIKKLKFITDIENSNEYNYFHAFLKLCDYLPENLFKPVREQLYEDVKNKNFTKKAIVRFVNQFLEFHQLLKKEKNGYEVLAEPAYNKLREFKQIFYSKDPDFRKI